MSTTPPPAAQPEPLSMAAVLRISTMRRLWIAQIISTFGDFLALFAVISVLTFNLHGTPQQVTGLQIAYMLPIAILGILAGVFVDRWPLKPTMVASDLIRAALVLLLIFGHGLWHFYLILAAISVVSSFFSPAQGIAIRSAVPLHGLRSANALMQQVMFGIRIVAPAISAFLVAWLGPKSCYYADSFSFIASACLIGTVALQRIPPATPAPAPDASTAATTATTAATADAPTAAPVKKSALASILPDMRVGISFILHHAGLLFVVSAMAAGMFIIGCFGPLIAVYVRDSLHASTRSFGVVSAMIGLGMFLGINLLNTVGKKIPNTALVYSGLAGIALGLTGLTLLTHIWSTILANLIIGMAVGCIIVPATTLMQQETPPALMGRVGSTMMSVIFGCQILGLILSGILADSIGVRHVFALCAVLVLLQLAAGKLFLHPKPSPPATA